MKMMMPVMIVVIVSCG